MTEVGSFALFRLPGDDIIQLYRHRSGAAPEKFVLGRFSGDSVVKISGDVRINIARKEKARLQELELPFFFGEAKIASPEKKEYLKQLENVIKKIQIGEAQKVVLSRAVEFAYDPDTLLEAFAKLEEQHPNAFVHLSSDPKSGTWLGATPETLISAESRKYHTMALAGTLSVDSGEWSEKEYREQALVTDYILQQLDLCAARNVTCSARYDKLAGRIRHLCTDISFESDTPTDEILHLLHPTPAVAGMPLDAAMKIIHDTEQYNRNFYCGYCGLMNLNESTRLFVNLRTAEFKKDRAYAFVGGGILADSDPEKEWQETAFKSQTILGAFKKM